MDSVQIQPEEARQRPIHPNGTFAAVCVDVIDLGNRVSEWNNEKKAKPTVALVFVTGKRSPEYTDPQSGEKKPGWLFELSQEFTRSLAPNSKLAKMLTLWLNRTFPKGVPFDLAKEVGGKPCMISVVHRQAKNGNIYANIGGVMPLPEGMPVPETSEYSRADFWAQRKERYAVEFENYMSGTGDMGEAPF